MPEAAKKRESLSAVHVTTPLSSSSDFVSSPMLFAYARSQKWRELMDELSKISCEDYRNVSASSAILPA